MVVRKEGLEPPYPFGYQILSLARLPIPPLSRQPSLAHATFASLSESPSDVFHGLFVWHRAARGPARLTACSPFARVIPDPQTGRALKVASVEVSDRAVCPACAQLGTGGYVSFESDLRLAFACPTCRKLVWLAGA